MLLVRGGCDFGRVEIDRTGTPRPHVLLVGDEVTLVGRELLAGLGEVEDVCGVTWVSAVGGERVALHNVVA